MSVKQSRKIPVIIVLVLIVVMAVVSIVMMKNEKEVISEKMADLTELYPSEDGTAPIIANGFLSDVRALVKDKNVYLSLGVVRSDINSDFFWDDNEKCLIYTTPSGTVTAKAADQYDGVAVFFDNTAEGAKTKAAADDRIFILLKYIAQYSSLSFSTYSDPARVFMRSEFGEQQYAKLKTGTALRTMADKKADVVAYLPEKCDAWVVSSRDGWAKVVVEGACGHVGYVPVTELTDVRKQVDEEPYAAPVYERAVTGEPICMAWHQVFNDSGYDQLSEFMEKATGANVISPTWFSVVSSTGELESRADHEYVKNVHDSGRQVWALVENFNTPMKLDYSVLFGKTSNRERLIKRIIKETLEYDIDGVNLDFESLPSDAGTGYIQFVKELAVACHENDIIISVDNYVPSAWTGHYHRDEQAKYIDYFVVMAYDEHYEGSVAGSTASLPFIRKGISDTVEAGVPEEMIIVGLPFYSRLWKGDDTALASESVSMQTMKNLKKDYSDEIVWDDDCGQYYLEIEEDGVINRVWIEDTDSVRAKLELINTYRTAGISYWKLGMETGEAWDTVKEVFFKISPDEEEE